MQKRLHQIRRYAGSNDVDRFVCNFALGRYSLQLPSAKEQGSQSAENSSPGQLTYQVSEQNRLVPDRRYSFASGECCCVPPLRAWQSRPRFSVLRDYQPSRAANPRLPDLLCAAPADSRACVHTRCSPSPGWPIFRVGQRFASSDRPDRVSALQEKAFSAGLPKAFVAPGYVAARQQALNKSSSFLPSERRVPRFCKRAQQARTDAGDCHSVATALREYEADSDCYFAQVDRRASTRSQPGR